VKNPPGATAKIQLKISKQVVLTGVRSSTVLLSPPPLLLDHPIDDRRN